MRALALASLLALWPLATWADAAHPVAKVPLGQNLRSLQEASPPISGAEVAWTAPAVDPESTPVAVDPESMPVTVTLAPVAVASTAPSTDPPFALQTAPPTVAPPGSLGVIEHATLDCWEPCLKQAGACSWCGEGNACCRSGDAADPPECKSVSYFLTLHHECVTVGPEIATGTATPFPTGLPDAPAVTAAPHDMVPAADALMTTTLAMATPSPVQSGGEGVLADDITSTLSPVNGNELDIERDRFIRATGQPEVWFQQAGHLTKHLVRLNCDSCGSPPPCANWVEVGEAYLENLTVGQDFSCGMLSGGGGTVVNVEISTTQQATTAGIAAPVTHKSGGGGSHFNPWIAVPMFLVCCCCGGGVAVLWLFLDGSKGTGSGKVSKHRHTRGGARASSQDNDDQQPLVLGQEDGQWHSTGFNNELWRQQQAAAMAPTYPAMSLAMGQQAQLAQKMAEQQQLPTMVNMTPQMQMQMQMAQQGGWAPQQPGTYTGLQTQALPGATPQLPGTYTGLQTQVLAGQQPGTYTGLSTQAAFGQAPEQEMELVTVTPQGLAVTPLAPGQGVPLGIPVLNQSPM